MLKGLLQFYAICLGSFLLFQIVCNVFDYGQSRRRCQTLYPEHKETIRGLRLVLVPSLYEYSLCYHKNVNKRWNDITARYSKIEKGFCGKNGKSYDTEEELQKAGTEVYHSGFCGYCSNDNDIEAMKVTRMNLTSIAKFCATKFLLIGYNSALECMKEKVGFSEGCSHCWVENMGCSITHCFFTCIASLAKGESNNKLEDGDINTCLRCDEENCGQMFLECAGANRRKCGIETDIGRPNEELWNSEL